MWLYEIVTGRFSRDVPSGVELLAIGYSGYEFGKNAATQQPVRNVGPLPTGAYWIGEARDTPEHGPVVMPLMPVPQFATYGRSGFLIHGDSIARPGGASHGCIILPRPVRERIAGSSDRGLIVITGTIPPRSL